MNTQLLYGSLISLLLHGAGLCSIVYVGTLLADVACPLVIDFSIEKTTGACRSCNWSRNQDQQLVEHPEQVRSQSKSLEKDIGKVEETKAEPKKIVPLHRKKRLRREEKKAVVDAVAPVSHSIPEGVRAKRTVPEESVPPLRERHSEEETAASENTVMPDGETGAGEEGASSSPEKDYIKMHFSYIKEIVQANVSYPVMARRMGWEGKVLVSFTVCVDGRVEDVQVVKSCGFKILDKSAMETIEKCAPFPAPPLRAELTLPITYQLD